MNGKIFLVLAVIGSLALSTNIVGTTFAEKRYKAIKMLVAVQKRIDKTLKQY